MELQVYERCRFAPAIAEFENVAAQVGGFAVENRVVGGLEFSVGGGVGEKAE